MASFQAKSLIIFNLALLLAATLAQASYEEFQFELYSHSLPIPGSFAPTHPPAHAPAPAPAPKHGHGHHHHHPSPAPAPLPPSHVPAHHPVLPPVHPPAKAPALPPHALPPHVMPPHVKPPHVIPPRKLIGVQGVVYCKHCKYIGVDTVWKAKPLQGAVVRLTCNNTKYRPVVAEASTDVNGYFLILAKNVTNAAFHKCTVALVKSSSPKCSNPTNFKGGWKGAMLVPSKEPVPKAWPPKYQAFNVGPFAYEPANKLNCTDSS